jgi:hypothetical protein
MGQTVVVSDGPAALPTDGWWKSFPETASSVVADEMTLCTVEMLAEYERGSYVERNQPDAATDDHR